MPIFYLTLITSASYPYIRNYRPMLPSQQATAVEPRTYGAHQLSPPDCRDSEVLERHYCSLLNLFDWQDRQLLQSPNQFHQDLALI
ncbi:hypothetical protein TNCV_720371 [Trichonephila clavipes]|nr:hypothetical protein TNCV_720371 [Trichonephila clavipes]